MEGVEESSTQQPAPTKPTESSEDGPKPPPFKFKKTNKGKKTAGYTPHLTLGEFIESMNSESTDKVQEILISFKRELTSIGRFLDESKKTGAKLPGPCIIENYLISSPQCHELFSAWKSAEPSATISSLVVDILGLILTYNKFDKTAHLNDFIAKQIIRTRLKVLYQLIGDKETLHMCAGLKLLTSVANLGPYSARDLFQYINFTSWGLRDIAGRRAKRAPGDDPEKVDYTHDVRTYFIRFCEALLNMGDERVIQSFILLGSVIQTIFLTIESDPSPLALEFLGVITRRVLLNPRIMRKIKCQLLTIAVLDHVVKLLGSKVPALAKAGFNFLLLSVDCYTDNIDKRIALAETTTTTTTGQKKKKVGKKKGTVNVGKETATLSRRNKSDIFTLEQLGEGAQSTRSRVLLALIRSLRPFEKNKYHKDLALTILRESPELAQPYLSGLQLPDPQLSGRWLSATAFLLRAQELTRLPTFHTEKKDGAAERPPSPLLLGPLADLVVPVRRQFFSRGLMHKAPLVKFRTLDILIVTLRRAVSVLETLDVLDTSCWGTFRSSLRGLLKARLPAVQALLSVRTAAEAATTSDVQRSLMLGHLYTALSLFVRGFPEVINEEHFRVSTLLTDCAKLNDLGQYRLLELIDAIPSFPLSLGPIFDTVCTMARPGTHPLVQAKARACLHSVLAKFGVISPGPAGKMELGLWISGMASPECVGFFGRVVKTYLDDAGTYVKKTDSLTGRLLICAAQVAESETEQQNKLYFRTIRVLLEPLVSSVLGLPPVEEVTGENFLLAVRSVRNESALKKSLGSIQPQLLPAAVLSTVHYLSGNSDIALNLLEMEASLYADHKKNRLVGSIEDTEKMLCTALLTNTTAMRQIIETSTGTEKISGVDRLCTLLEQFGCTKCAILEQLLEGCIVEASERSVTFAEHFVDFCPAGAIQKFLGDMSAEEHRDAFLSFFSAAFSETVKTNTGLRSLTKEILAKAISLSGRVGRKLDWALNKVLEQSASKTTLIKCSFDPTKECFEEWKAYAAQFFERKEPTQDHATTVAYFVEMSRSAEVTAAVTKQLIACRGRIAPYRIFGIWKAAFKGFAAQKTPVSDEEGIIKPLLEDILSYPQAEGLSTLRVMLSAVQPQAAVDPVKARVEYLLKKGESLSKDEISALDVLVTFVGNYERKKAEEEERDIDTKKTMEVEIEDGKSNEGDDEEKDTNITEEPKSVKVQEDFYVVCMQVLFKIIFINEDKVYRDQISVVAATLRKNIAWAPVAEMRKKDTVAGESLMKLLRIIAKYPRTIAVVALARELIHMVFTKCKPKRRLKRLESVHEAIVKNMGTYRSQNVPWEEVANLLHIMYSMEPGLCVQGKDVVLPTLAERYSATLGRLDRKILCVLKLLDQNGAPLALVGYAWGRLARTIFDGAESDIYHAILSKVSGLLKQEIVENTLAHYPFGRSMTEDDITEEEEEEEEDDETNNSNEENNNKNEKTNKNSEKEGNKGKGLTEVYDPAYLLPVLMQVINNLPQGGSKMFIDVGALQIVLCSLGAKDETLLKISYAILFKFMKESPKKEIAEKNQVMGLLTFIRNSVTSSNMRFSTAHSTFFSQALPIIAHPDHNLYTTVNKFILSSPSVDLRFIPMFAIAFEEVNPTTIVQERVWMLQCLATSISPSENVNKYYFHTHYFIITN